MTTPPAGGDGPPEFQPVESGAAEDPPREASDSGGGLAGSVVGLGEAVEALFAHSLRLVLVMLAVGFALAGVVGGMRAAAVGASPDQLRLAAVLVAVAGIVVAVLGLLWWRRSGTVRSSAVPLAAVLGTTIGLVLIAVASDRVLRPTVGFFASDPTPYPGFDRFLVSVWLAVSFLVSLAWQHSRAMGSSLVDRLAPGTASIGLGLLVFAVWALARASHQAEAFQQRAHYTPAPGVLLVALVFVVAALDRRLRRRGPDD